MNEYNFCIAIPAVGEKYILRAINLIQDINTKLNCHFLILTNNSDCFKDFLNVDILYYNKDIFSYHDKRLLIQKAACSAFEYIILMDADHRLRETNTLESITNFDLSCDIYPQLLWKHPASCSFENFLEGKTFRVPYGIEYKKYCLSLGLDINNIILIQESFLLFKNCQNIKIFLDIWNKLACFCEQQDLNRRQGILGYGEGYSIAVAAHNANLKIIENNDQIIAFIKNFKHLAWEK